MPLAHFQAIHFTPPDYELHAAIRRFSSLALIDISCGFPFGFRPSSLINFQNLADL